VITRLFARLRKLRRAVSRAEWTVRLLSLPRMRAAASEPGLILIQIDGLARPQLEKALAKDRMPFLSRLLRGKDHRLVSLYSGLPSTTPAVQGELFYGVKCAVPAFQYRDRGTKAMTSLLSMQTARAVQARLRGDGRNLLAGGSAYGDVYTGSAKESSFCAAARGFGNLIRKATALPLIVVLILHAFLAIRIAALTLVEMTLAFSDVLRGVLHREHLLKELNFVPARVALCIVLRELTCLGMQIDAVRGVPIIHGNFLGYDEQSHRRGPSSRFAHWTLKGVDRAIRDIWRAARRSSCGDYDVWIYSDHGQERVSPYEALTGKPIRMAVAEVLARHGIRSAETSVETGGIQLRRVVLLGGRLIQRFFGRHRGQDVVSSVEVAAMGPVTHVYPGEELAEEKIANVARDLAENARIPLVLVADGPGKAKAWTAERSYSLPEDGSELAGRDHPFAAEIGNDIVSLAHHEDAGQFVLLGWAPEKHPITFAVENGAHGGFARNETHAFALLPHDVTIALRDGRYATHLDLRSAALETTQPGRNREVEVLENERTKERKIRIMTYNVHACIGMDGKHSPERIARVIAQSDPDIVALQELDVGRSRTGGLNQARRIAELLEMKWHFHPSLAIGQEQYGNAVLSRMPMRLVKADALPGGKRREPRGALWVEIGGGVPLQLFNTHLGLNSRERMTQIRTLLGTDWLDRRDRKPPVVVCGDFNAGPRSRVYRELAGALEDMHRAGSRRPPRATWLGLRRIDYVFASPGLAALHACVIRSRLARVASDHLPLLVDLRRREDRAFQDA